MDPRIIAHFLNESLVNSFFGILSPEEVAELEAESRHYSYSNENYEDGE